MKILNALGHAGLVFVVALIVVTGVLGCGGSGGLKLVPVSGIITTPDGPLANAGVSFRPDASKGNTTRHVPSGTTDASGKYELITGGQKGAPAGWYKVVVIPPTPVPGAEMPTAASGQLPFAAKYMEVDKSDLQVEVKPGAPPGAYDLKLEK